MRQQGDGEVHGAADVDIYFLVGFGEVEVVDVEGTLDAGVVYKAV
jgi:hypothetical protein